jgi:hypothetical protein
MVRSKNKGAGSIGSPPPAFDRQPRRKSDETIAGCGIQHTGILVMNL